MISPVHPVPPPRSWLMAFLVAVLLWPLATLAQPSNLSIEVEAALGGFYRPGRWVPVSVRISNQPGRNQGLSDLTDFQGQLLVVANPLEGNSGIRFQREVDIPRASTKRYILYTQIPEPETPNSPLPQLRLTEPNGRMIGAQPLPITPVRKTDTLIVNVGDVTAPPALPRLRDQFDRSVFAQLAYEAMPDFWTGYDAADIVVFHRWPDRGVPPPQRQALLDWVSMGGTLVFLGGSDSLSYSDPAARELLPVEITNSGLLLEPQPGRFVVQPSGQTEGQLPRGSFVTAVGTVRPGADALLTVDGLPIISRRSHGLGQIIFFSVDLQSQSVGLERLLGPAWLGVVPVRSLALPEFELNETLSSQLRVLVGGAGRPPNPIVMILICIAYAFTVGPINFMLLSRFGKLDWAWFTLPAIVVVFFALIYGVGRLMKGDEQMMRELVVERYRAGMAEGASLAVTSTFVSTAGRHGLYPAADRGAIEFPFRWHQHDNWRELRSFAQIASALTSTGQAGSANPLITLNSLTVDGARRENLGVRSMNMGTYDARLFLTRGPSTLDGDIEAALRWTSPAIVGTITNRTRRAFVDSWFMMGGSYMRIGPLPQGATFRIEADDVLRGVPPAIIAGNRPTAGSVGSRASRWVPEEALFVALREYGRDDETVDKFNMGVLLDALVRPRRTGSLFPPDNGRLYFVGLSESDSPRVISSIAGRAQSRLVMTMVELDPLPEQGDVLVLAPGVINRIPAGYAHDQAGLVHLNGDTELVVRDGRVFIAAELPFVAPGMQVEQISITMNPRVVTHQDWRLSALIPGPGGGWLDIQPNVLLDPNRGFVMPGTGRVFLRFESQKNESSTAMTSWSEGTGLRSMEIHYRLRARSTPSVP